MTTATDNNQDQTQDQIAGQQKDEANLQGQDQNAEDKAAADAAAAKAAEEAAAAAKAAEDAKPKSLADMLDSSDADDEDSDNEGSDKDGDKGTDADADAAKKAAEEAEAAKLVADAKDGDASDRTNLEHPLDEIISLRTMLRTQKKMTISLQAEIENLKKQLVSGGTLEEEDPEAAQARQAAADRRTDELETFLENMRLSAKFSDVDEVVTQARADDLMDQMAAELAKKQGISLDAAIQAVEQHVWVQWKNPYRELYTLIKQYHPDFAKKTAPDSAPSAAPNAPSAKDLLDGKKDNAPKKGAPSLAGMNGGDAGNLSGWTAAKIDALPEDELNTVPSAVYEQYIAGLLS